MTDSRYRVVETSGLELIGALINQMNEQGYRPLLMSQIVKTSRIIGDRVVTTLVFERETVFTDTRVTFDGSDAQFLDAIKEAHSG